MTSEWRDITLGDFVALQRGHDLTEPERRTGRIPVIGSAGPNGFHDTSLAKGPGIVIGRSGASFGQVHFSKEDFW
ncbi:MAG: S subunit, partial [Verrucomicrobia bacterium]